MSKNLTLLPLFVVMMIFITSGMTTVQAQPRNWQAWLYSQNSGTITLIDQSGANTGTVYLPLTQAFNAYGSQMVVSPNGRYVAYTAFDSTRDTPNLQLFVYDRQVDVTRFAYDLSGVTEISFGLYDVPTAFDENQQRFAFGYLRDGNWRVVVADLIGENVLAELDGTTANTTNFSAPIVPVIQTMDNNLVAFTMVFHGTGPLTRYPAYVWNTATGGLSETSAYSLVTSPVLEATGAVVIPTENADFPAAPRGNANVPPLNVLDVYTPINGNRVPFYNDAEKFLTRAYFIRDGGQVLVEAFNPANNENTLKIINRDGSVAGEFVGALEGIVGTPNGFAGTFATGGGIALAHVDTTSNEFNISTLWTSNDPNARLVHIQGLGTAPSQLGGWTAITP